MTRRPQLNDETKPPPILGWIVNRMYDTVFHIGDTTQNFLWDALRGTDNANSQPYHHRQLGKRHRQGETPLTTVEKQTFEKVLKRYSGEKLIEYWKRKKALLNHPDKKDLVRQYQAIERRKEQGSRARTNQEQKARQQKLEAEFRALTNIKHTKRHKQGGGQKR